MTVNPYGRTIARGVTLNYRTLEMLEISELRGLEALTPLVLTQGSYHPGVSQSGGTHDAGGVFDVRASNLSSEQRTDVLKALRRTGFAAWLRTPRQGDWPYHIHAVAIGDKELSPQAAQQVVWYKQGKNGLWPDGGGTDTGPDVAWTEYRQEIDLSYYGPAGRNGQGGWDDADFARFDQKVGPLKTITDGNGQPRDLQKVLQYIHGRAIAAENAAEASRQQGIKTLLRLDGIEQTLVNYGQQLAAINAKLGIEITPSTF